LVPIAKNPRPERERAHDTLIILAAKYGREWIVPWPNAGHDWFIGNPESTSSRCGTAEPESKKSLAKTSF
jgi:hypothetical protein